MRHRFTLLVVFAVLCCGSARAVEDEDQVALAKDAERSMHRAVDSWAAAKAGGKSTTQPAADIRKFYFLYIEHASKAHYIPNAVILVPKDIACAGVLKDGDHEMSYLVGGQGGQFGAMITAFERTEWPKDRLPGQGILCFFGIDPRELEKSFEVTSGESVEDKRVLKLHYILDGKPGVIEIRRDENGWAIHPDRGIVPPDHSWNPYAQLPATRPAE